MVDEIAFFFSNNSQFFEIFQLFWASFLRSGYSNVSMWQYFKFWIISNIKRWKCSKIYVWIVFKYWMFGKNISNGRKVKMVEVTESESVFLHFLPDHAILDFCGLRTLSKLVIFIHSTFFLQNFDFFVFIPAESERFL